MRPFLVPHDPDGNSLPLGDWSTDQLQEHIANLETLQDQFVRSQAQHLDELSTLNRMAAALAARRSFDEVVNDALREVYALTDCQQAWIVEAKPKDPIGAVHVLDDPVIGSSDLPDAVARLCRRIHAEATATLRSLDGRKAGGQEHGPLVGFPICTNKHLLGSLVVLCGERDIRSDEHCLRLIRSLLRQAAVACENDRLVDAVGEMMIEVVYGFAQAVESRDPNTGGHVQRVTAYALLLARRLGLPSRDLGVIQLGGLLHDIGKIGVPDAILRKPGPLTPEEFAVIKTHPVIGHEILRQIPQLQNMLEIVRHHHERWDGSGYPDGLTGDQTPHLARLLAIADAFDAMTSDRPYRPGMPFEEAMAEIARGAGTQFDPQYAQVFTQLPRPDLEESIEQMQAAFHGHDHPGTVNVTDLLSLDMRRLDAHPLRRQMRWQTTTLRRARSSDHTVIGASPPPEPPSLRQSA